LHPEGMLAGGLDLLTGHPQRADERLGAENLLDALPRRRTVGEKISLLWCRPSWLPQRSGLGSAAANCRLSRNPGVRLGNAQLAGRSAGMRR
jgi:hypothetical protein